LSKVKIKKIFFIPPTQNRGIFFLIFISVNEFLRTKIRDIVYNDYNHLIIDSARYLEFEDLIIKELYHNHYLEEGFSIETIVRSISNNIKKY
jgi:hypothetical protein